MIEAVLRGSARKAAHPRPESPLRAEQEDGGAAKAADARPVPDTLTPAAPDGVRAEASDAGGTPPPDADGSLAPAGWYPPAGNPWHRRRKRLSRRQWAIGILSVLVVVAAVVGAPRLWTEMTRGWDAVLRPADPTEENRISPVSPPPEPPPPGSVAPGPVNTGLPGSAGAVTGVALSFANGSCAPGGPCTMRIDVDLDPAANVPAVTWNLTVFDRCTGAVLPGADVTVPVPPGAREAYGLAGAVLPPSGAVGLAAVTTAPAAAASAPVLVPAENAVCPPEGSNAGR
ncbi:hypothetical protein [Rhodococcus gannanensis]|uniref:Uncharacterized protein n=1 Tax=Rhodococcus gannanensis TaxID=1960308 RepID=A0ABW4NZD0_9NOCA